MYVPLYASVGAGGGMVYKAVARVFVRRCVCKAGACKAIARVFVKRMIVKADVRTARV